MTLGKRGIIFLALSLVAFVFAIVGTPLRMATVEQTQSPFPGVVVEAKVTYTMWKICTKVKQFRGGNLFSESNTCRTDFTCANDLVRAARAFSIMSIIVLALVCCVLGALDMLCKLPADPKGKLILIAAAAVGVAFTVITWACQVGLYRDDCTGQSVEHADGSKIRESAPLFIVATGLMIIATIVAAAVPGPVEEVHTVAGKAEVVNPDGTVDAVPQNQPETKVPVVVAHEPVVNAHNEPVA